MIKEINSYDLKNKMQNGEDIVLIDVREVDEWNAGHIPSAEFMPLSTFNEGYKILNNKNAEIILQCRSGVRSLRAAQFLEAQGFTNLTNLAGGILGWAQNGYEVIQD